MVIFHNRYCSITYNEQESLLHLLWLQQPDTKVLLSIYQKGIDFAIEHQIKYWIADNNRGFNFDVSMQRALAEFSAQRLPETNVLRFARVVPQDVFQELVSHKILNMINQLVLHLIEFELFSSAEDAKEWLLREDSIQAYA